MAELPSPSHDPIDGPDEPRPDPVAGLRGAGQAKSLGAAGRYAGLGIQFAASILVFLYAGQWLDRRLGSDPLFLYVGVFTGAGAAFYSMYRNLMADQQREEREQQDRKER